MPSPDSYPVPSQPIAPDRDERLLSLLEAALKEDIGDGDHSTLCCIPRDARGKAVLKIKQAGILAGMDIAEMILKSKEPSRSKPAYTPSFNASD
jgi:nicotinate-nucleotide pyrophosphorylase